MAHDNRDHHRAACRAAYRARYARWVPLGLCQICGAPAAPFKHCLEHRRKMSLRRNALYAARKKQRKG